MKDLRRKPIKPRNPIAQQMVLRTGNHSGTHRDKALRGSGKGKGKGPRYPKHKGGQDGGLDHD